MCGRFNVIDNPGLQDLLRELGIDLKLPTATNVAPTEQVPLVTRESGIAKLDQARWWLTPSWAKQVDQKYAMFNARCESLSSKAAYKKPFVSQRGIIPMSNFIEWRKENGVKQPYCITNNSEAFAIAALWDVWHGGNQPLISCTIVTTAAASSFQPWHSRMPVVLTADEYDRWLDNSQKVPDNDSLFRSELKTSWVVAPIDRRIGDSRNKDPLLHQPLGELVNLPVG